MNFKEETPVPSTTEVSSDNSVPLGTNYGNYSRLRAQLDVTAASGTSPTLDVTIEDTLDETNFNTVATFATLGIVGREVIEVYSVFNPAAGFSALFANRLRVAWAIGGTSPSFTFSVRWIVSD